MLAKRNFIMMAQRWRDDGIHADRRQRLTNRQAQHDILAVRLFGTFPSDLKKKELGLGQRWHTTCDKKVL